MPRIEPWCNKELRHFGPLMSLIQPWFVSALGQTRSSGDVRFMSAFLPIATKSPTSRHFDFGPTTDIREFRITNGKWPRASPGVISTHIHGTRVPVEKPFTESKAGHSSANGYRSFEATSVRYRGLDRQNDLEQGPVFAVRRRNNSTAMALDNRAADSQS